MSDISEYDKLQSFVNWPNKTTEYFDNGNVTIGSIGFPGTNVSGSPTDGSCDPETVPASLDESFTVEYDIPQDVIDGICFRPNTNVELTSKTLSVQIDAFAFKASSKAVQLTLSDNIIGLIDKSSSVVITVSGEDTMESTKLPNSAISGIEQDEDTLVVTGTLSTDAIYDYEFNNNEFALTFNINTSNIYILLNNQDDSSENGLYIYTESKTSGKMTWRKLGTLTEGGELITIDDRKDPSKYTPADPTVNDSVGNCCDHFRKSYSDREVSDYVDGKVGTATHFGVHPGTTADLNCAGNLIKWLTADGTVDIGNGHKPIFVNGFGLGNFYSYDNSIKDTDDDDESVDTLHPLLTWAYGSKWSNKNVSNNLTALPLDWPFSGSSSQTNNNITLVTHADDGTEDGIGNLEYDNLDGEHVRIDKHHIVIYNDFEPNNSDEGDVPSNYKDGSTVIKPLFIHIPAPITTKDGDTFDVTVSLQNVNTDKAFPGKDKLADMSAYYAFLAQPRVYVMGGVQKFSSARLKVNDPDSIDIDETSFTITTVGQILDISGTALPVGKEVRINLTSAMMSPSEKMFAGTITSTSETATTIKITGNFPYGDIGGRGWHSGTLSVCGIAYLDDEEDGNPTNTSMGLLSRQDEILGSDYGTGSTGEMNQYNKFFSISKKDGYSELSGVDKRYVLATVYQTATNTFPWRLDNRRRLKYAADVMTDEIDKGKDSILASAWNLNLSLLQAADISISREIVKIDSSSTEYGYALTAKDSAVSYGNTTSFDESSVIGTKVRVASAEYISSASYSDTSSFAQPVRQASRACHDLIRDLLNYRAVKNVPSLANSVKIGIGTDDVEDVPEYTSILNDAFVENDATNTSDIYASSWRSKLRHLPEYITYADTFDSSDPYCTSDEKNIPYSMDQFEEYFNYSNYAYDSMLDSTACTAESECSLIGVPATGKAFSENSVVLGLINHGKITKIADLQKLHDVQRMAETSMFYEVPSSAYNIDAARKGSLSSIVFNPFAQVYSNDFTPSPSMNRADLPTMSDTQRIYLSADVIQQYAFENDDFASVYYASETLPTSTALAEAVKHYVPAIGNNLRSHFYNSMRIVLKDNKFTSGTDPIYLRTVKWRCEELKDCDLGGTLMNRYLNDSFLTQSAENSTDYNISDTKLCADEDILVDACISQPPCSNTGRWARYDDNSYTRVYMQFTFSARAGRWYTTEYRQYPTTYLTPLYGANALKAKLPSVYSSEDKYIWCNSACVGYNGYASGMYSPYTDYPAMDITLGCVPYLYSSVPYTRSKLNSIMTNRIDATGRPSMSRLAKPYLPVSEGGIELYPPSNVNGEHSESTDNGIHANFWSVRQFLRPAVSALDGTDVPSETERKGGCMSDAPLYAMFDLPKKDTIKYILPNRISPKNDMSHTKMEYSDGTDEGNMLHSTGNLIVGLSNTNS